MAFIVIVQVVAKVKSNNFIEMNQLNEWQIVVLAASLKNSPASDLITADLKNMLRTFFFIPFNGSVNIQFCIYTDFDLNELFFDNSIVSTQNQGSNPNFHVLRMCNKESMGFGDVFPDLIYSEKEQIAIQRVLSVSTTSPWTEEHLATAFSVCNAGSGCAKTLMLTFGHGDGFAIFGSGQARDETLGFDTQGHTLNMDCLAAAIKSGFPKGKIDLLLLQNCFMMTADSLFALQHVADFLVAPQTAICFYGFHYKAILESILFTTSVISAEALCRIAVDTIPGNPAYCQHDVWLQKLALFGADLRLLRAYDFFELQDELITKVLNTMSKETLIRVRRQIVSPVLTASFLLSSCLIDLYAFFSLLKNEINHPSYTTCLNNYWLALSALFDGQNPRVFRGTSLPKIPAMHINGISGCIPLTRQHIEKGYYPRYYRTLPSKFALQSKLALLVDFMCT